MIPRGRRIARAIFSRVFMDLGDGPVTTVFVAGTGRSGTTWIGDLVNYRNDHRVIFEPFYPRRVPAVRPFGDRPYMRPGTHDAERAEIAERVVSGSLRNPWSDGQNLRPIARRRVVKEIRANLMLKWLRELFPDMPVVFCVRHPCAVVNSRTALGWEDHLGSILAQPKLVQDHLLPWIERIERAESAISRQAILWCIETLIPLRQLSPGDAQLVFYENFCAEPRAEIDRLFGYLGRPFDDRVLRALNQPSWVSRSGSAVAEGKDPLTAWQRGMPADAIDEVLETVGAFGLGAMYGKDALPDRSAAEEILST